MEAQKPDTEISKLTTISIAAKLTIPASENKIVAQIVPHVDERKEELSRGPAHCKVARKLVSESSMPTTDSIATMVTIPALENDVLAPNICRSTLRVRKQWGKLSVRWGKLKRKEL